jgi:hypothetical protein
MTNRNRGPVVASVVVFVLATGALTRSNALASVRSVDALLLFVAGMAAGAALTRLLGRKA